MALDNDMLLQTTPGLAPGVRSSYDKTMLAYNSPELLHAQFAEDRPVPGREGEVINFRRMDRFAPALVPLQEGVTPNPSTLSEVPVQMQPLQYGDYKLGSDKVQVTQIDDILAEIVKRQGTQSGETFDIIARDAMHAGTSALFPAGRTARNQIVAADILTGAQVRRALSILKKNFAKPRAGGFVVLISPDTESDIFVDPEWRTPHNYGDQKPIYMGEIGMLYGARFVTSPLAKTFAGQGASGVNVSSTLVFGQDAFLKTRITGLDLESIFMPPGSGGAQGDPLKQKWSQGWKGTFAAKVQNDANVVRIEHSTTYYN